MRQLWNAAAPLQTQKTEPIPFLARGHNIYMKSIKLSRSVIWLNDFLRVEAYV